MPLLKSKIKNKISKTHTQIHKNFFNFFVCVFYLWSFIFCFSVYAQQTYPQLDISGYKKWEYKNVSVAPQKNYFAGLTQLGGFYPTYTGGPWQERLQLRILGELSENLSVSYDLEQQPELPDKYDVTVKYYNSEITFGDFNANFSGNEFASASKFLNGVRLSVKDGWYDILAVPSAKVKSQTQMLTARNGNNTRGPYSLGHGSIVEGTEHIELNGVSLTRNKDYTIDYFEGKITFSEILTSNDEFKYSYEYTNILDIFFPTLSKRDFFGYQARLKIDPDRLGRSTPEKEPVLETAQETFPGQGLPTTEAEEQAAGQYRLKFTPLVKFSETLTFMGTKLAKNEDYIVRYDQGMIKLLTRYLPTSQETLTVEYQYYQTSQEAETLAGIGSRGSYKFAHPKITPYSERIAVDGRELARELEYDIDYNRGEVTFGREVSSTSQIQAEYSHQIMILPTTPKSKFPKELILGGTYLKESAQKGESSPTATVIEATTGNEINDDDSALYLANFPLSSTAEVAITVNGVSLTWEVDYTIPTVEVVAGTGYTNVIPSTRLAYINDRTDRSDGLYTGTIKFLRTLNATDEVRIIYTYQRSTIGKYNGTGDGTRGPYYLRNIRNIVPGSETVQVWEQGSSIIATYTRNSSFEADAGNTGYSINYTEDNPSITFNNDLETSKNFQIIFEYVPPTGYEGGDIAHEVYGYDVAYKYGEVLKIEAETARSSIDQSYTAAPTTETLEGSGSKNYTLHSPYDLIEGTEKIYVNGYLRNKDIDYFISYTKPGAITFYYITPTTQDAIMVEYEYQSPLGVAAQTVKKTGQAYGVGVSSKLLGDKVSLSTHEKGISYDFTPMGGTSIGMGSRYRDFDVGLKPDFHSLTLDYSYKENNNPISGTAGDKFLRTYDNSAAAGLSPFGKFKVDLGYRRFAGVDDLLTPGAFHNSDTLQDSLSGSITPGDWDWKRGLLILKQKHDFKRTLSETDTVDKINPEKSRDDYWHSSLNMQLTDRFSANYDLQTSEPIVTRMRTVTNEAGDVVSTSEAEYSHARTRDTAYGFSLDLTAGSLQKWIARVALADHQQQTLRSNFVAADATSSTKNETYRIDLVPTTAFTTSLDHSRQEQTAVTVGAQNPKTIRTAAAAKLTPNPRTILNWDGSQSDAIQETGAKTSGRNNSYGLEYILFSFERIKAVSKFIRSGGTQSAPSGTWEVATDTNSFRQDYALNVNPYGRLPVDFSFSQEDYANKNNSVVSPVDTETRNQTIKIGASYSPFSELTLSGNYNQKITKDLKTGENRPKLVREGKADYKVFSGGVVTYSLQEEKNEGEIQAGSIADYDFKKVTQNISLNFTVPQDSPVLSSIVFIASLKQVGYENYKNRGDDFTASLLTFEGTLNF